MKKLLIIFVVSLFCFSSATENLSFKNWNGYPFPSLHRTTEQDLKIADDKLATFDNHDPVLGMIRLQSARVAEMSLAAKPIEELQCFKRTVCLVGATGSQKEETDTNIRVGKSEPMTLAKGVEHFKDMLQTMKDTITSNPSASMEEFPTIQQILGSYEAGITTKDVELCETLFPCSSHANDLDIPNHRREGRATCKAINAVCPGISIGCALCAGFLPGQCGNQCIIAGIYCGSSLIACGEKKKQTTRRKPKIYPTPALNF